MVVRDKSGDRVTTAEGQRKRKLPIAVLLVFYISTYVHSSAIPTSVAISSDPRVKLCRCSSVAILAPFIELVM